MMLVSVDIPDIRECFDFRIENEDRLSVAQLKQEITEEVCRWKKIRFCGETEELRLYDRRLEVVLADPDPVSESGIRDGDELWLF
uniref:hypothetical protein n=1 Tax=Eubacterium cellulosolvens TaxID=29322 RepID=UPI0004835114|nr:hypothetical protein [[Eubacterium] cellulosolvens]